MIGNAKNEPVRDPVIIAACQRIEHYEIAAYSSVCNLAEIVGESDQSSLLENARGQPHRSLRFVTRYSVVKRKEQRWLRACYKATKCQTWHIRDIYRSGPMTHIFKVSALYLAVAITMPGLRDTAHAAEKVSSEMQKRLQTSVEVLTEVMSEPDKTIPPEVLARAKCVAVIPSVVKVALGVGGRRGKGLATCRTTKGWSAPGPISISGESIGLQIGTQSIDIILVILDRDPFKELLVKKFKIGSEVAGTPGPTGSETALNNWRNAKILTYSRSHGVFAGETLKGATLKQDKDGIVQLYGRYVPIEALLEGKVSPPRESQQFLATVRKYVADAQQHTQG